MAEEGSEGSVANSSSWELHGNSSLSSWTNVIPSWHLPSNPNSNSSCEEEISISNHSGLSTDDSPSQLMKTSTTPDHTQLWSKVLLSVGGGGLRNNQDVGENFLEALSSKNLSSEMFEPVCDYLKKMDNSWEFTNTTSYNNIERQLNGFTGNFPNLVTDWSIAPPCPEVGHQRNISVDGMDQYADPDISHMKQNLSNLSLYGVTDGSAFVPCYGHDMEVQSQQHVEASEAFLQRYNKNNSTSQCDITHNSSVMGDGEKYYYGVPEAAWFNTRNLSDVISFNGCLNKPVVDTPPSSSSCLKTSSYQSNNRKQQNEVPSAQARGTTRGAGGVPEGKKKRSEDSSETQFKKPKHETTTGSSTKVQVPKVKLTDRITTLQQIVAPFGKTDTASVLQEAIGYIKFLQEQVQLLSNPYMKTNANKDPWGLLERKEHKAEAKFDLKSRGLCLVPISCTPQVYRESIGSDYWTPTYRGCLYR